MTGAWMFPGLCGIHILALRKGWSPAFFLVLAAILFFPAVAAALVPGQVMADPANKSWLVYNSDANKDGKLDPVFVCGPGDPENFLYRGTRNQDGTRTGDQASIISNIRSQGANSIYLQAVRSHGGDGDATHNPFIDSDPANQLDEDILRQWDGWFASMDQAGIIIYFFFYDDSAQIWSGDAIGDAEEYFITSIVNRYAHLKNLVWVIGEEYSERYSRDRISNIAALIRQTDANVHPIANHQLSGLVFDHPDDPNIDQFAIQYNDATVGGLHSGMLDAWKNAAGRYSLIMAESIDHGLGDRALVRQKNWASAMGGASVMVIRMDGTAEYNDKMRDCATLAGFFEATDFNTMAPHDELGNEGTWVLANPGKSYIAYRWDGGGMTLRGMTAGRYFLRWLDTTSGAASETIVAMTAATNTFFPPAGMSAEVALWLTRIAAGAAAKKNIAPFLLLLKDQ